jgi:hypothetical protein
MRLSLLGAVFFKLIIVHVRLAQRLPLRLVAPVDRALPFSLGLTGLISPVALAFFLRCA